MAEAMIIPEIEQAVSLRQRSVLGDDMPLDGASSEAWTPAYALRADKVTWRTGPHPGFAELTYVHGEASPAVPERFRLESAASRYHVDDQVRIEVYPLDAEIGDGGRGGGARVIFEGVLERQPFKIVRQGEDEDEQLRFVAVPFPALDNARSEHIVRGRSFAYVADTGGGDEGDEPSLQVATYETPLEGGAAVFNPGRPNRYSGSTFAAEINDVALTTPVWSHDDDPYAAWWTGATAIAALLGRWLVGLPGVPANPGDPIPGPLSRFVTIEPATLAALNSLSGDTPTNGRFDGLQKRVPELDVTGMGVFDAVQAVCEAIGFEMSILPNAGESGVADRTYQLRLWRRGSGPLNDVRLQKSGEHSGNQRTSLDNNDVSRITGVRDGHRTVNEVFAVGPTYIEAVVECKPLWRLDEYLDFTISSQLQAPPDAAPQDALSQYFQRYVKEGSEYDSYGHVGRVWGVDCVGVLGPTPGGDGGDDGRYPDGSAYRQWDDASVGDGGVRGFDWTSVLDFTQLNTARGHLGVTDPIRWHRGRLRRALPLRNYIAQSLGVSYRLEVSEDAGGTWEEIDEYLNYEVLTEYFGFRLLDIANLARVNAQSLREGLDDIPVTESWWALIDGEDLLFRLNCAIEADHAARYDATRQASSGTIYRKGRRAALDYEELWLDPSSPENTSDPAAWQRVVGWGVVDADADYVQTIREIAERLRDRSDVIRVSASCYSWLARFSRWTLGDRIWGVRGRDIPFSGDASGERAPTLVGLTFELGEQGEDGSINQGVTLELADREMTEGVS